MIWLMLLVTIPFTDALKFFEHSFWKGSGDMIEVHLKNGECYNFPHNWNDKVSSVDTAGQCIIVFEHIHCSGESSRIAPGTPSHGHLVEIGFNDKITSIKSCSNGGGGGHENNIFKVAVDEHNKYRRRHGSPPLVIDDQVTSTAQKWADHLARNSKFEHSRTEGTGENLAGTGSQDKVQAVRDAVKMWYNEEKNYDYNKPGFSMNTGHFTAVVWKSTKSLGIGVAWDPVKRWSIVVAQYSPPGNSGDYEGNVKRPL